MIALGQEHAVAIERNTRRVAVWGDNSELQCALPSDLQPAYLVAAGEAHSATIANGSGAALRCWGRTFYGQCAVPALGGQPVKVACGHNHTLAIVHDQQSRASVRAWGSWGSAGQQIQTVSVEPSLLNQPIGSDAEPVEISGGSLHSMCLLKDGTVVCWGVPGSGQTRTPGNAGHCRAIAAGGLHSVAITTSDRVAAWGSDVVNQVSGPETLAQVPAVAAGDNRTLVYVDTARPLPNDIDGDGVVNGADLGLLLEDWYANIDCGG